jgi:single-stranded DNA-binding protein
MSIRGTVTGKIVADPEDRKISDKFSILTFPLYANRRVKNRETGEYENDPQGTTKLTIELKFDQREQWLGKLNNKDVVTVTGSFFEREYDKKDGGKGRQLQSDFIESVEIKFANPEGGNSAPAVDNDDAPF